VLQRQVGADRISQYIEDLLRPLVTDDLALEAAYREMAADSEREREALEWIEAAPDDSSESHYPGLDRTRRTSLTHPT
jgi:hypothetical protein